MNKPMILIVEDDAAVRNLISTTLKMQNYKFHVATTGSQALLEAVSNQPDIMLLDLGLPDMDGVEIITKVRSWSNMPIIVISARCEDRDKIEALDAGADDYITKPYNPTILLLRIAAVLKRMEGSQNTASYRDAEVNFSKGTISKGDQEMVLTKNEMIIFQLLLANREKIVSRDEIMTDLWDNDEFVNDNALTVNISRLRGKLADLGYDDAIETRKKQGYRLV